VPSAHAHVEPELVECLGVGCRADLARRGSRGCGACGQAAGPPLPTFRAHRWPHTAASLILPEPEFCATSGSWAPTRRERPRFVKASNEDLAWLYPGLAPREAARTLLALGPRMVIVTLCEGGATAITADHRHITSAAWTVV
jgi:hypothetical protein